VMRLRRMLALALIFSARGLRGRAPTHRDHAYA
jgi:hypothetical protein